MSAQPHTTRSHAKLSPSASKRWLSCPGCIPMQQGIPDTSSAFADEGSGAHELAQKCLETGHDADKYAGWFVNLDQSKPISPKSLGNRSIAIDDEMVDGVQVYLDFCRVSPRSMRRWSTRSSNGWTLAGLAPTGSTAVPATSWHTTRVPRRSISLT